MPNAIVTTTDKPTGIAALGGGPSVLGESQLRLPVGGKIRAGIKVLTKTAATHTKAGPIYDAGVAAGKPWADIERELVEACRFDKSPLTPKNVSYFTVRPCDFIVPETAAAIVKAYGSDGADGFQLYRFPVVFPVDAWQAVMPHGLNCYTRSERVYWSQYTPDGRRHCMTHGIVPVDPRSKRALRTYGGRPVVPRADNGGICDPEKCPEYQARQCKLTGSLLFYIPGIPGSSAIELPTTSFYSMQQARSQLELVAHLRGGRLSGTIDGKPVFYITKKQREVSMIDPATGKATKKKQWLIEMEADIDMTRVFQASERAALAADRAALALDAPPAPDTEIDDDPPPPPPATDDVKAVRRRVNDALTHLGLLPESLIAYCLSQDDLGEGWSGDAVRLARVEKLLDRAATDDDLYAAIKNAVEAT